MTSPTPLRRALSLGLYFSLLLGISGVWMTRHVSAELGEASARLGAQLGAFQELTGRTTSLTFNGQQLAVSTVVIDEPVEQVLSRFVDACDAEVGNVGLELAERLHAAPSSGRILQRALVLRDLYEDGTGVAVCLAGLGAEGLPGLIARTQRFASNGDLGELGQLRYAHLRKVGADSTHLVLVASQGPLKLGELIPADGQDAHGEDVIVGVRPPDAVRLISAHARGTPHHFAAYRSRLAPELALANVGEQLMARGLVRAFEPRLQSEAAQTLHTATFRDGASAYVVTAQPDAEGSTLSVTQLASSQIPRPGQVSRDGDPDPALP